MILGFQNFANKCVERCQKDFDVVIVVTGDEGVGKSTFAIQLARRIGNFKLSQNVLFSPNFKRVSDIIRGLPKYAPVILDEAIKVLYKLNWHEKIQILLNQFYAVARQENKISILCIPRFSDLNEYFRNHRVKIWCHVLARGKCIVFVKDKNPMTPDVWHIDEMGKRLKKMNFNAFAIETQIKMLRRNKCFVGVIHFPDLPEKMAERYKELKAKKKYEVDAEEMPDKIKAREKEFRDKWILSILYFYRFDGLNMTRLARMYNVSQPTIKKIIRENEDRMASLQNPKFKIKGVLSKEDAKTVKEKSDEFRANLETLPF